MKKKTYSPPSIKPLALKVKLYSCTTGSGASVCNTGNDATPDYCANGGWAGDRCSTGSEGP